MLTVHRMTRHHVFAVRVCEIKSSCEANQVYYKIGGIGKCLINIVFNLYLKNLFLKFSLILLINLMVKLGRYSTGDDPHKKLLRDNTMQA